MSVFKKVVVHPMPLKCKNGHVLVRFELAPCDGGHDHKWYGCPMRLGSRPCGDFKVVPPYGPGCEGSKDKDDAD